MLSMLHLSTYQGVAAREAALLHGQFTPRGKALLMLQSTLMTQNLVTASLQA